MDPCGTLASVVRSEDPETTVFWTGAGVSADAPTSAPVGYTLVERALGHAFEVGTGLCLGQYYSQLRLGRTRPRLETVLEVVRQIHGDDVLLDVLSDLEAQPNKLHSFFAQHLSCGGSHITTNFDTCIERASAHPRVRTPVLHVHGALCGGDLGATLGRVERGLPNDIRTALDTVLLDRSVRLIVFAGYSGSDFFDVDPYLRNIPEDALRGRKVVWLHHDHCAGIKPASEQRQLLWLERAGAHTMLIAGRTRDGLNVFARMWGIDELGIAPPRLPHWTPQSQIDDEAKARATLELYAIMGLHNEVTQRLDDETEHQELLAHTRWAQGRYRAAGQSWANARKTASLAAREERAGAVLWIRGEYTKARDVLVHAIQSGAGSSEEQLLLAETLARVLEHSVRYPDVAHLASEELRTFVLEHLPDPEELAARGEPVGTHLRQRVHSVRRFLGARINTDASSDDDAVAAFGEFEALNAQLLYRQGELRKRLGHGHPVDAELRQQRDDFLAIGAIGDAARAVLLGGPKSFTFPEVLAAACRLDVTPRHRLRLIVASVLGAWQHRSHRA